MDILYIVGNGSKCDNLELRCSLRSLDMYGKNIDRVFVVGNCPEWLSDKVIKLPCPDPNPDTISPYPKNHNIAQKLLYAVDNSDLGDEFLVSMDDHFYVKDTDFNTYPWYIKNSGKWLGELPDAKKKDPEYTKFVSDCKKVLKELGLPTKYFALHKNMHVLKQAVLECREMIEDLILNNKALEIFILLSNYSLANLGILPTMISDNRLTGGIDWYKTSPDYDHSFSTPDFAETSGLYTLVKGRYPNKSKYEIEEDDE